MVMIAPSSGARRGPLTLLLQTPLDRGRCRGHGHRARFLVSARARLAAAVADVAENGPGRRRRQLCHAGRRAGRAARRGIRTERLLHQRRRRLGLRGRFGHDLDVAREQRAPAARGGRATAAATRRRRRLRPPAARPPAAARSTAPRPAPAPPPPTARRTTARSAAAPPPLPRTGPRDSRAPYRRARTGGESACARASCAAARATSRRLGPGPRCGCRSRAFASARPASSRNRPRACA